MFNTTTIRHSQRVLQPPFELRALLYGQAKLLALRARYGLRLDRRSLLALAELCKSLAADEASFEKHEDVA